MSNDQPEWLKITVALLGGIVATVVAAFIVSSPPASATPFINKLVFVVICMFFSSGVLWLTFWGKKKTLQTISIATIIAVVIILLVGSALIMGPPPNSVELTDTQIAAVLIRGTQSANEVATAEALGTQQQSMKATETFQSIFSTVSYEDKLTQEWSQAQTKLAIQKTQTQETVLGTAVANSTLVAQSTAASAFQATKSAEEHLHSIQATTQALVATQAVQASATAEWISTHSFIEDFSDDKNNWAGKDSTYEVAVSDNALNVSISPEYSSKYFFWSCDSCYLPSDYNNYSLEITIRPPERAKTFVGLVFGSNEKFGKNIDAYIAKVSLAGSFSLYRLSSTLVENPVNIPFAEYISDASRNLLSIRIDVKNGFADVYVNEQILEESPVKLQSSIGGYLGIFIERPENETSMDKVQIESIHIYPIPGYPTPAIHPTEMLYLH